MSTEGKSGKPDEGEQPEKAAGKSAGKTEKTPERVLKAKATEPEPKKRNWKAIGVGALVFVALVGSLAAWLQGKASRQPEIDRLEAEVAALEEDKSELEATVEE